MRAVMLGKGSSCEKFSDTRASCSISVASVVGSGGTEIFCPSITPVASIRPQNPCGCNGTAPPSESREEGEGTSAIVCSKALPSAASKTSPTARRIQENTAEVSRKRTSVLAGCTLTSTSSASISKKRTICG